jgi:GDP-L-fucose synthase
MTHHVLFNPRLTGTLRITHHSKVYVAGHRGLVGSAILCALKSAGYKNIITRTSADLDLRRQAAVERFFDKEKPEYVFLAAAKVGGIHANSTYTADFIYDNIMIAANVINAAYRSGTKKLLNLGSSCIYPRFCRQPMKEESLLTGELEPTNEPYAIAKISAIKLCRYYNEQYGTNFVSLMPTNLYGPGDNFDLENSHVLPALIRKFHLAKLLSENRFEDIAKDLKLFGNGTNATRKAAIAGHLSKYGIATDSVTLWGSGKPFREFLYVEDLANAAVFVMERYDYKDIGEFINIGAGRDLKIKKMALIVKNIVGFKGAIKHDLFKPDGMPKKLLDITRIKSLGWEPKIQLEEGIKKTYQWYCKRAG